MFARIRFDWQDNQRKPLAARVLRVQTIGGQRARLTWQELADMVGDLECRRLFSVAIRRGSGHWHGTQSTERIRRPRLTLAVWAAA